MKKALFFLSLVVNLAFCYFAHANANITGASWDYGSGDVSCVMLWDSSDPTTLNLDMYQSGSVGQMNGGVTTDSAGDPTLTMNNEVDNNSSFAWTSYYVDVYMNVNFSFSGISVANPLGWAGGVLIAPHQVAPFTPQWTGTLIYYANGGPPVNNIPLDPNNVLDFTYKVSFLGSTSYNIQEVVTAVPEPGALSLLLAGGFLAGGVRVLRRRQTI